MVHYLSEEQKEFINNIDPIVSNIGKVSQIMY